jgi:hypothetical protein
LQIRPPKMFFAQVIDMNPLGFVPDLSMRGVDNSIEEKMTFSARLQPFKAAP